MTSRPDTDRLQEIKRRAALRVPDYDREWLIAEVERLRRALADTQTEAAEMREHWVGCQQLVTNAEMREYREMRRAEDAEAALAAAVEGDET